MPEGGTPMRGSAAPTSPGAWDARSEALLGAPALTPPTGGTLDLRGPEDPAAPVAGADRSDPAEPMDGPPSGIGRAQGEAAEIPPEPGDTAR
ncbi:hypothetical protein R6L23_33710, partial [Streptomyces sp. SR27]|nr:hypothetical protein [Streptomyces sp. SR27]